MEIIIAILFVITPQDELKVVNTMYLDTWEECIAVSRLASKDTSHNYQVACVSKPSI